MMFGKGQAHRARLGVETFFFLELKLLPMEGAQRPRSRVTASRGRGRRWRCVGGGSSPTGPDE
eukprot:9359601-Pyramimonas_sp.AAC.1